MSTSVVCYIGRVLMFMGCILLVCGGATASDMETMDDLTELSIQELMDLDVTSVSKKKQKLLDAAAAVYVITGQDLHRSGVTSIPEALRMVPGVQVAQIDASKWAISARGFNAQWANKLLVLIDGRTVYSPLYSGVYWDVQDLLMEDIERIEVIRGPGASLWGANAVNGVINIITKTAADTQGGLISVGAGTVERALAATRYGGSIRQDTHWRVYAKYHERDADFDMVGNIAAEDETVFRLGFRMDSKVSSDSNMTLQGDVYAGDVGTNVIAYSPVFPFFDKFHEDENIAGGNVLLRWRQDVKPSVNWMLQLYYDRSERENDLLEENRDTLDLELQGQFSMGSRHEVTWGLGYRYTQDDIEGSFSVNFDPDSQEENLFNLFIQDDILLIRDLVSAVIGVKLEHNDYSDFEVQPSLRFSWTPNEKNTLWAAVSRAVRTPSRSDHDIVIHPFVSPPFSAENPSPLPVIGEIAGSERFDSEELLAFELGYRVQISGSLSLDVATFYNEYDNLQTGETGAPYPVGFPAPSYMVFPIILDSKMEGETYGVEVLLEWRPLSWWRCQTTYAFLQIQLHADNDSTDTMTEAGFEGGSPHHTFGFRSMLDLPGNINLDLWSRYVDNLPVQNVSSYVELDARLSWMPANNVEIELVGQNLLDSEHTEFFEQTTAIIPEEIERRFYGKITWRF